MRARILLYITLFTLRSILCTAQTWESVGGGIVCSDSVFSTGWSIHCPIIETVYSSVYAMSVYQGKLYVGGLFKKTGDINANNIASWNGDKWDSLGSGINGSVMALGADYQTLVVGGVFDRAGGKYAKNIAKWVDTSHLTPSWYYYSRGVYKDYYDEVSTEQQGKLVRKYADQVIYAIKNYKGDTYIGGDFLFSEEQGVGRMAVWKPKNNAWLPVKSLLYDSLYLSNGFIGSNTYIQTFVNYFTIYNNELYVMGSFVDRRSGYKEINVMVWNGNSFHRINPDFPSVFTHINCAVASDSGLYFGGEGAFSEGIKQAAIVRLNTNGTYKIIYCLPNNSIVRCMVYYDNKLYIGGQFDSTGDKSVNNIAMWDGRRWHNLGAGLTKEKDHRQTEVMCLCIYKGYLYAGGSFDHSGNKPIENIARWKLN